MPSNTRAMARVTTSIFYLNCSLYIVVSAAVEHPRPPFSGSPLPLISFYRSIEFNRFPPNCRYRAHALTPPPSLLFELEWGGGEQRTMNNNPTVVGISNRRRWWHFRYSFRFVFGIHILLFKTKHNKRTHKGVPFCK